MIKINNHYYVVYQNGAKSVHLDNLGEIVKQTKIMAGFNPFPE